LLRSIAHARRSRATLCIAKLDRLARNTAVVAHLKKAGVRFDACGNPFANEVSKRVKALHPAGVPAEVVEATAGRLGASLPQCRNVTQEAREKGARAEGEEHRRDAEEAFRDIAGWMAELRGEGLSQAAIAQRLNQEGHTTRGGKVWGQVQVGRVLRRAGNT
jgi:hypothetical protein